MRITPGTHGARTVPGTRGDPVVPSTAGDTPVPGAAVASRVPGTDAIAARWRGGSLRIASCAKVRIPVCVETLQ
jgi:hypothetical protein